MRVETKDGLVVNKPRVITRRQQQPTSHTCMLYMGFFLQASGAGKYCTGNKLGIMLQLSMVQWLTCPAAHPQAYP